MKSEPSQSNLIQSQYLTFIQNVIILVATLFPSRGQTAMELMSHNSSLALCNSSYSHLSSLPRNSLSPFFQCNLERHINIHERKRVVAFPRAATATENSYRRWVTFGQKGLTALALTAALHLCPPQVVANANASEFDILNGGPPTETFVEDDAGVVNRVTKSDIKRLLSDLESRKGYHINCVTLRKLTVRIEIIVHTTHLD